MIKYVIIGALVVSIVIVCSCCVVSGRISRQEEARKNGVAEDL